MLRWECLQECFGALIVEDFPANPGNKSFRSVPDFRGEFIGAAECIQQITQMYYPGSQRDFPPGFSERTASVCVFMVV